MATYTTNYHMTKPATTDNVSIAVLNANFDTIDAQMKANSTPTKATTSAVGVVKPDGTSITIDNDGTIHGATVAAATTSSLGTVKPDGTTITVDNDGTIHGATTYTLPTASANTLGGIKVGTNLSIDANGVLSSTGGVNEYTADAGCNWLANVATYSDIATTYPSPSEGDTVLCLDTSRTYYYDGSAWILINNNVLPEYTYAETMAILTANA